MEFMIYAAILIGMLLIIALITLLLKKDKATDNTEQLQRMEALERAFYEAIRDLRSEQTALARASRMENQQASDRISEQIDKRVARLADLTNRNLEQIRFTVDERLSSSLEQKFSLVSSRLEEMHRGLGEMQSLAGGVDELRRILTNVKTRGIWGEMQLATLLYDILPKARVAENVEIRPRSNLRVEFALRIPHAEGEILLPIDAKFPQEDYQRLQSARESGSAAEAEAALKQLERRLKSEAKDIRDKYIQPPYSTDFAVMYLPSEGLFTEAVNIDGLMDELQRSCRVCLAGPTTLAALLSSLQAGFRTVAIRQQAEQVWQILTALRHDTELLLETLEKTGKKLSEAESSVDNARKKAALISRKLKMAEEIKTPTAGGMEDDSK